MAGGDASSATDNGDAPPLEFHEGTQPTREAGGPMPPMTVAEETLAMVSLGLLCGLPYMLVIFAPLLLIVALVMQSKLAGLMFAALVVASIWPIDHKPNLKFMRSYWFALWRKYLDYSWHCTVKLEKGQKHVFLEFPHGVVPVAQIVSASVMEECFGPDVMICGLGASVLFSLPGLRQFYSALGLRPADKKSIKKILSIGQQLAVTPGGVAEMFLVREDEDRLLFSPRKGIIKNAIREGAHLVPVYFYNNNQLFKVPQTNSMFEKISRKMRTSIFIFWGRFFLPIPLRHRIKASPAVQLLQWPLPRALAPRCADPRRWPSRSW